MNEQLSLEFDEYPTAKIPDFNQMMSQKVETIKAGGFDPHKLMVQKKLNDSGEYVDTTPKQNWPEKDIKTLEDFCSKYGIMGFNCGRMSPIAALGLLKQKLGLIDSPSITERIPYSDSMNKKTLLMG